MRLEAINLASNMFGGELPASLSWCPMLRVIRLRNNSLSGEIAIDFTLLSVLNTLDIGTNGLIGAIPPGIALCSELRTVNLVRNKLMREIPESFKYLRSLSYSTRWKWLHEPIFSIASFATPAQPDKFGAHWEFP